LVRDSALSIYIYSQEYEYDGRKINRVGFICLMGLDIAGKKQSVLAHENTLASPKADRLNLMKEVKSNLSPIFVLYDDNRKYIMKILKAFIAKSKPIIDVVFDKTRHKVWDLSDPAAISKITGFMKDKKTFIADGHHRYETARNYSLFVRGSSAPDELKKNSGYVMVYFVEADEGMLTVLPAHRLVKDMRSLKIDEVKLRLRDSFIIKNFHSLDAMMSALSAQKKSHAFGLYLGKGDFSVLKMKDARASDKAIKDKPKEWRRLDVSILHHFILQQILGISDDDDNIEFVKNPADTVNSVDEGAFKMAFFLNPTKVSEVKKIAKLGERMPRKATYFYPKPLSGLVINKFY
jgi:uncharacterized protein (DUF1015 family)